MNERELLVDCLRRLNRTGATCLRIHRALFASMVAIAAACATANGQTTNSATLFNQIFHPEQEKDRIAAETNALKIEFNKLAQSVSVKLGRARELAKVDLSAEIKELDFIYAKYQTETGDARASVLRFKADLYINVLHQPDLAVATVKKLVAELPDTPQAKEAAEGIEHLQQILEGRELGSSLKPGLPFPDFDEQDWDGHAISLRKLRGKVVMLDFWNLKSGHLAGAELLALRKTYQDYHAQGFEIIGINMYVDEASVRDYVKTNGITWPQYFDGKGIYNKLALRYVVYFASDNFLIDADGDLIGQNLYPQKLKTEVGNALQRRSNLTK